MLTEKRVAEVVRKVWNAICPDIDWAITAEEAADMCLDADRPVTFGGMTEEENDHLLAMDYETVNKWAENALTRIVR